MTRLKWRVKKERVINKAWNNDAFKMMREITTRFEWRVNERHVINDEWNNEAL